MMINKYMNTVLALLFSFSLICYGMAFNMPTHPPSIAFTMPTHPPQNIGTVTKTRAECIAILNDPNYDGSPSKQDINQALASNSYDLLIVDLKKAEAELAALSKDASLNTFRLYLAQKVEVLKNEIDASHPDAGTDLIIIYFEI